MSRRIWLGASLAMWLCNAAIGADAVQTLVAGDAALARFDLDGASSSYRQAKQAAPDNYEAAWKLARSLADKATLAKDSAEQKRLCIEAESVARDAVRLIPNDPKGHTYLAIAVGKLALYEGGKRKVELSKEVKAEADKATVLNPKEDLAYHVLGVWNREMAELNWILKKFAEFLYGKFPPASLEEAATDLRRATEIAPHVVPHHVELGITLIAARQCAEARKELNAALAMPKSWVTDEHYKELAKVNLKNCPGT